MRELDSITSRRRRCFSITDSCSNSTRRCSRSNASSERYPSSALLSVSSFRSPGFPVQRKPAAGSAPASFSLPGSSRTVALNSLSPSARSTEAEASTVPPSPSNTALRRTNLPLVTEKAPVKDGIGKDPFSIASRAIGCTFAGLTSNFSLPPRARIWVIPLTPRPSIRPSVIATTPLPDRPDAIASNVRPDVSRVIEMSALPPSRGA